MYIKIADQLTACSEVTSENYWGDMTNVRIWSQLVEKENAVEISQSVQEQLLPGQPG